MSDDEKFDPIKNILDGMKYIADRYGSLFDVQQAHTDLPPIGYEDPEAIDER